MPKPRLSDGEFVRLFEKLGAAKMARQLGVPQRGIYSRRESVERSIGRQLTGPPHHLATRHHIQHPGRINLEIQDGIVLVGSDAHYWPGPPSLMHRAFVKFCKELKPKIIILNGDVLDFAGISRHAPIGWEKQPDVYDEIENAANMVGEIEGATFKARKIWSLGNHDGRFETYVATHCPKIAKVKGVHLKDHFPNWEPCWSAFINDDVVVKHRFKGGTHANHNNTLWAGRTIVTGHLHSAKVIPFTDYNGDRWGVDTGCIADPAHRAFLDYTEDNPKNWRDGFCVLTFHKGRLLPPELVSRWADDNIVFRGEIVSV